MQFLLTKGNPSDLGLTFVSVSYFCGKGTAETYFVQI
jgi:hypothetical protein